MIALDEWKAKATLLEIGEVLYISAISATEARQAVGKFEAWISNCQFMDYSLVVYMKPKTQKSGSWWVCIAKVPRTDTGFVKQPDGSIVNAEDKWISREAERLFKLAIEDGKKKEDVLAMAQNKYEIQYVKELWKTLKGEVVWLENDKE